MSTPSGYLNGIISGRLRRAHALPRHPIKCAPITAPLCIIITIDPMSTSSSYTLRSYTASQTCTLVTTPVHKMHSPGLLNAHQQGMTAGKAPQAFDPSSRHMPMNALMLASGEKQSTLLAISGTPGDSQRVVCMQMGPSSLLGWACINATLRTT